MLYWRGKLCKKVSRSRFRNSSLWHGMLFDFWSIKSDRDFDYYVLNKCFRERVLVVIRQTQRLFCRNWHQRLGFVLPYHPEICFLNSWVIQFMDVFITKMFLMGNKLQQGWVATHTNVSLQRTAVFVIFTFSRLLKNYPNLIPFL